MEIIVRGDIKKFFKQYIEVLQPILRLRRQEVDTMSELLYQEYKYKDVPKEIKDKLINHPDTRREMRKSINISVGSFNNILSVLRKKKLIEGVYVNKNFRPNIKVVKDKTNNEDVQVCEILFKFVINYGDSK